MARPATDSRHYILAFELHSMDDCPRDFELPASLAGFDTGLFLPRDDPDWFGRSAYPPRILLLRGDALHVVTHPSAEEPPCRCPLERISAVESGHMLLNGWLRFTGPGFDCTVRYNTRGFPAVFHFMSRFRSALLPGAHFRGTPGVHCGDGLDIKFGNALAGELDFAETVLAQIFRPPGDLPSRNWLAPRPRRVAGDLLALTDRRLLWITDRDRGFYSRYGSIASYAPIDALRAVELRPARTSQVLFVDLNGDCHWQIPIAPENCGEVSGFLAEVAIQKGRNGAGRAQEPR
jgi:hypothetical protein